MGKIVDKIRAARKVAIDTPVKAVAKPVAVVVNEAVKNDEGKMSLSKVGLIIAGACGGILQQGVDIIPNTTMDTTVLFWLAVAGLVMSGLGFRDAISKIKNIKKD